MSTLLKQYNNNKNKIQDFVHDKLCEIDDNTILNLTKKDVKKIFNIDSNQYKQIKQYVIDFCIERKNDIESEKRISKTIVKIYNVKNEVINKNNNAILIDIENKYDINNIIIKDNINKMLAIEWSQNVVEKNFDIMKGLLNILNKSNEKHKKAIEEYKNICVNKGYIYDNIVELNSNNIEKLVKNINNRLITDLKQYYFTNEKQYADSDNNCKICNKFSEYYDENDDTMYEKCCICNREICENCMGFLDNNKTGPSNWCCHICLNRLTRNNLRNEILTYQNEWAPLVTPIEKYDKIYEEKMLEVKLTIENVMKENTTFGWIKRGIAIVCHEPKEDLDDFTRFGIDMEIENKLKNNFVYWELRKNRKLNKWITKSYKFYYDISKDLSKHKQLTQKLNKEFIIKNNTGLNSKYIKKFDKIIKELDREWTHFFKKVHDSYIKYNHIVLDEYETKDVEKGSHIWESLDLYIEENKLVHYDDEKIITKNYSLYNLQFDYHQQWSSVCVEILTYTFTDNEICTQSGKTDIKLQSNLPILNIKYSGESNESFETQLSIYIQYVNRALEIIYNKYDSLDKYIGDIFNVNDYKFILNNIDLIDIAKYNENIKNGDTIHIDIRVRGGDKKLKKKRELAKMKKIARQHAKKLKKIIREKTKIKNELKETQKQIQNLSSSKKEKEEKEEKTNMPQDWNDFLDSTKNPKYNPFYIYSPDKQPLKNKVLKNDGIIFMLSEEMKTIKDRYKKIDEFKKLLSHNDRSDDYINMIKTQISIAQENYNHLKGIKNQLKYVYSISYDIIFGVSSNLSNNSLDMVMYTNKLLTYDNVIGLCLTCGPSGENIVRDYDDYSFASSISRGPDNNNIYSRKLENDGKIYAITKLNYTQVENKNIRDVKMKGNISFDYIQSCMNVTNIDINDTTNNGNIQTHTYNDVQKEEKLNNEYKEFKQKRIEYKTLQNINNKIIKQRDNFCLLDYLLYEFLNCENHFRGINLQTLIEQFKQLNIDVNDGISINDLRKFIVNFYPQVSFYCLLPTMDVIEYYNAKDECGKSILNLTFIINNNHCYPIINKETKEQVARYKMLKLDNLKPNNDLFSHDMRFININATNLIYNKDFRKLIKGELERDKIYLLEIDLSNVISYVIKETGYLPEFINISHSKIKSFYHPCGNYFVELYEKKSMEVLNKIKNKLSNEINLTLNHDFQFRNQSITTIGINLFNLLEGEIPQMILNKHTQYIFDNYAITPHMKCLHDFDEKIYDNISSFDHNKSYASAVRGNKDDYNVFTPFDECKPFDKNIHMYNGKFRKGSYLIKPFTTKHGIQTHKMELIPYFEVQYLLDNSHITYEHIYGAIISTGKLSKNLFKNFESKLREIFDLTNDDEKEYYKQMIVCFLGSLNRKYKETEYGCITNSDQIASGLINEYIDKDGKNCSTKKINDINFIRVKTRERNLSDTCAIWQHVISLGRMNLYWMLDQTYGPNSTLLSYNTDSIVVNNPKMINDVSFANRCKMIEPAQYMKKEYVINNNYPTLIEKLKVNKLDEDDEIENESFGCIGGGGFGKSTKMINNFDPKNSIILTFTGANAQNIKDKLKLKYPNLDVNKYVFTFDSRFNKENGKSINLNNKKILVDEFFQAPKKWITKMYLLKQRYPKMILQFYGDSYQTKPVETCNLCKYENSKCNHKDYDGKSLKFKWYKYTDNYVFLDMIGYNMIELKYKEESARYNKQLYDALEYFKIHKRLPISFLGTKLNNKLETNICKYNDLRKQINERIINQNNGVIKKYICTKNVIIKCGNEIKKVYNSQVVGSNFYERVNKEFQHLFEPCYAATVYKFQGRTINENYNIYDVERMSFREMYTSLSRATCMENIHFDYNTIKDKVFQDDFNNHIENWPIQKPKHGSVYKLYNEQKKLLYNGQTNRTLEERFNEHFDNEKSTINRYFQSDKKEWKIELLSDIYYFKEHSLDLLERKYIANYNINGYEKINIKLHKKKVNNIINKIEETKNKINEKISHLLHIEELKDCYRIKYTINGERKEKRCRFSKKTPKEQAFEKINNIRNELLKELYNIDIDEINKKNEEKEIEIKNDNINIKQDVDKNVKTNNSIYIK